MSDRDFPRVLAAEGVSNFGAMLSRLAIPWLATLGLQATPMQMSALLVADVLAGALGSLLLGGIVDRAGKRAVMLGCDLLRCAVLAALAFGAWSGQLVFAALLLASAANGCLSMAFELARSAWIAQCVPVPDLARHNAQLSMTGSLSETAAFAIGGWLYQGVGAVLALLLDALSYAVSALCLRPVHEAPRVAPPADAGETPALRRLWRDAAIGLRTVAGHATLRVLAGIEALLALGMSLFGSCFMIFVARDIGFATGPLGMVFAVGGLGAIAGAALAPRLGRRLGAGRAMAVGLALLALGSACVPLVVGVGWLGIALLVAQQVVGDGGHTVHDVHDRTLRQTQVPHALLARADAGIRTAGQIATLAGALLGGLLGSTMGTRATLALAAALFAVASCWALLKLPSLHGPAAAIGAAVTDDLDR